MSKSRSVIRKQIYFVSLLKSKNALLIQMIHNRGGFFGSYLKPDTLDTWSEGFLYYGSKKSEYSHWYLETILILTAAVWQHCNLIWTRGMHQVINFIPFIQIVNCNTNGTCIALVHKDKSRQNYTTSPAHLATVYFSSKYLISRLIFKRCPWANCLE